MSTYSLAGTILLLPLCSAITLLLFHGTIKKVAPIIGTGVSIILFILSLMFLKVPDTVIAPLFEFIRVGDFSANINVLVDSKSRGMLFIVTFIGMLVHLFSLSYMAKDDAKARYFASLSLFLFSMIGIVFADNLVMMFIFWELVGVSSYLLIGHWFKKDSAADAANKAFMTNRVGDFGFMAGILLLFGMTGQISFEELQGSLESGPLKFFYTNHSYLITFAALGIFLGAMGKSAQFPLHVWLPDAMEGPTPVSALIHAATMVAAGVYMLVRMQFLFIAGSDAATIVSWIGGITALLAALMATQQTDIKKVLAYSTLSQLGYMVLAVGILASKEAMFHLYTHAFFKALLFLGSGAVIYACHHQQEIWKMGGLREKMPVTFVTFVIGTAALIGVPLLSGFYSKESILAAAYEHDKFLFAILWITAALTAYYMTRLVVVVFFGKARSDDASHAHEAPFLMTLPLIILAVFAILSGYGILSKPLNAQVPTAHHESHQTVLILSVVALLVGLLSATRLYKGKDKDPVSIPLFANKFYFDEMYAWLVKYGQDRFAWIINGLDKIFIDGLTTRLPAALSRGVGGQFRKLQNGNLQVYSFLLGLGIAISVCLALIFSSKH